MQGRDITVIITNARVHNECTNVGYPQIGGLINKTVQNNINEIIKKQVTGLIPQEGCSIYEVISGSSKITLNNKGILSTTTTVYTFKKQAANGLTVQKSVTVDLETGRVYQLQDLFDENSNYKNVISNMIRQQIKERNLPLIKEFKGITGNEDFYLTQNGLVIYFQEIEYTPHYVGIPEFVIPYSQIKDMLNKEGPIARLMRAG